MLLDRTAGQRRGRSRNLQMPAYPEATSGEIRQYRGRCKMRFQFKQSRAHVGDEVSVRPGHASSDPQDCTIEFGTGTVVRGKYQFRADTSIMLEIPGPSATEANAIGGEQWQL